MPSLGSLRRGCVPLLFAIVALAAVLGLPALACGQATIPTGIERQGPMTPQVRAELYRQLRSQAEVLQAQAAVVKTVVKLIGPTVVHIEADVTNRTALQRGRARQVEEAGSGVIIQHRGEYFVLTNRHVVNGATPQGIKIKLADGRLLYPTRVLEDPETDVAVLASAAADLVAAPLGDSQRMEIGDFVLAVGSPFGLSQSVTYGIISAKGRRGLELGDSTVRLQDFLQTDAAINPGNSGGPLINLQGEVIGINTAIASNSGGNEGIGFAIPVNMFMAVARQLIEKGKTSRAFLGVTLDSNFGPTLAAEVGLPRPVGARILEITPNSPAAAAKLQAGDVIIKFNDTPIDDDVHLVNTVNLTEVGKDVPVVVFRGGQTFHLRVTVADRSQF